MKKTSIVLMALLAVMLLAAVGCKHEPDSGGGLTFVKGSGNPKTAWYDNAIATKPTEDKFFINTPDDLAGLAVLVNDMVNPVDFLDKTITLRANLDLSLYGVGSGGDYGENGWIPIGWYDFYSGEDWRFAGTFDGNHKIIKGLSINNTDEYVSCLGLFGIIGSGGTVKNLALRDSSVISAGSDVGGVAGQNYGTVEYCAAGDIVISADVNAGGVVGWNDGPVKYCAAGGSVEGRNNVGGVVGNICGDTVEFCAFSGSVSGNEAVGGVAGFSDSELSKCYASGDVSGQGNYVGGVVGDNFGTVQNCYFAAAEDFSAGEDVSGESDYVGGVAGRNYGTVENCYAAGTVEGDNYVGGVAGSNEAAGCMVESCVAMQSSITGTSDVCRVVGINRGDHLAIVSNYANADMEINGLPTAGDDDRDKNGQGWPVEDWYKVSWWAAWPSFDRTVWTLEEGRLPRLEW